MSSNDQIPPYAPYNSEKAPFVEKGDVPSAGKGKAADPRISSRISSLGESHIGASSSEAATAASVDAPAMQIDIVPPSPLGELLSSKVKAHIRASTSPATEKVASLPFMKRLFGPDKKEKEKESELALLKTFAKTPLEEFSDNATNSIYKRIQQGKTPSKEISASQALRFARLYQKGDGVEQDTLEGYRWLFEAAFKGDLQPHFP